MNDNTIKLIMGVGLFATWVGLTAFQVPHTDDIVQYCKAGLVALGSYHFGSTRGTPAADTFPKA